MLPAYRGVGVGARPVRGAGLTLSVLDRMQNENELRDDGRKVWSH